MFVLDDDDAMHAVHPNTVLMEFSQLSQLRVNRYRNGLSAICPIYSPIATEERSSRDVLNLTQERTFTY